MEPIQFGFGVLGIEPPVDGVSSRIALGLIDVDGPLQGSLVSMASVETGAGQHAELVRHDKSAIAPGNAVKLHPFHDCMHQQRQSGYHQFNKALTVAEPPFMVWPPALIYTAVAL